MLKKINRVCVSKKISLFAQIQFLLPYSHNPNQFCYQMFGEVPYPPRCNSVADTIWASSDSVQSWHCLPESRVRLHGLRAQFHKTAPIPPPDATRTHFWPTSSKSELPQPPPWVWLICRSVSHNSVKHGYWFNIEDVTRDMEVHRNNPAGMDIQETK